MAIIRQESMHADSLDAALERARRDRKASEERRRARQPLDTLSRFAEAGAPLAGAGIGAAVGGALGGPAGATAGFGAGGGLGQGLGGLIGLGRGMASEDDQALADREQLKQQQLLSLLASRRG